MDSPISAVLFDFDGVLMGSQGALLAARQLLRSTKLRWSGAAKKLTPLDVVKIFELSDLGDNYKSLRLMYRKFRLFLPNRLERLYFLRKMGNLYRQYDTLFGRLIPRVAEILQELHTKGVPLAIVSNSMRKRVEKLVGQFGIRPYLSTIITRDDMKGYEVKPSPYPILICLLKLKRILKDGKIKRQQVYFVGDLPTDIQCARNAKVRSIAVTTGHGTREELQAENPDHTIAGVESLFSISEFEKIRTSTSIL